MNTFLRNLVFGFILTFSIPSLSQDIDFKAIIYQANKNKVYALEASNSDEKSTLKYLGAVSINDTNFYLINHTFQFPTAAGSMRRNQRLWVLKEYEAIGYYMIVENKNSLPQAIINNQFLDFAGVLVDFVQLYPNCLMQDGSFCFTPWKFEIGNKPSGIWKTWRHR